MNKIIFLSGATLFIGSSLLRIYGYDLFMPADYGFETSLGFSFSKAGVRFSGILRLLEVCMGAGALVMVLVVHRKGEITN